MDAILVSRKEAAQALGLGRGKLDQLITAGAIQVRRIGRRVLISREELQRFATDHTSNTRKRGKQAP
jgi:excisionase family DNA binding protein